MGSELVRSETDLRASRGRMETAIDALAALEPRRVDLEQKRDDLRAALSEARTAAAAAQQSARELAVQVESRRSSHTGLITTLARVEKQMEDLEARRLGLAAQLADGEAPLAEAEAQLERELRSGRGSKANCRRPGLPATNWTPCCANTRQRALQSSSRWKPHARVWMRRVLPRGRCACAARELPNS